MKKILFALVLAVGAFLLFTYLQGEKKEENKKEEVKTEQTQKEKKEQTKEVVKELSEEETIKEVLQLNLDAAESEDLELYLSTLANEAVAVENENHAIQNLFDTYDIDYELVDIEDITIDGNTAKVKMTQSSKALEVAEGYMFNDNVAVATHTLIKEDGKWKIAATEVNSVELLTEQ